MKKISLLRQKSLSLDKISLSLENYAQPAPPLDDLYYFGYNFNHKDKIYTRFGILFATNVYLCTRKGIITGMTLSEHIKQKRKKNGLTQIELAERAGVGLRFVRDLEQGKQTLRMDKVNDVLVLFGERLGPVKINIV